MTLPEAVEVLRQHVAYWQPGAQKTVRMLQPAAVCRAIETVLAHYDAPAIVCRCSGQFKFCPTPAECSSQRPAQPNAAHADDPMEPGAFDPLAGGVSR